MASDLTETTKRMIPSSELTQLYFTATKAAQNDTITFGDFRVVYGAVAFVDDGGSWAIDVVTVDDTTVNKITLTSAETGTVHGIVWGKV